MQSHHILFNKEIVNFFLNIDNKKTANAVGQVSKSSKRFRYEVIKTFSKLGLVTTKPLQLTKKGELLRKELIHIYKLLDNGYK